MSDLLIRLITDAVRLFGRVHAFDLECPACGHIVITAASTALRAYDDRPASWARPTPRHNPEPRGTTKRLDVAWNPITGRFRCPYCGRIFATGLLVWEVTGPDRGLAPEDHVPTDPQREELKDRLGEGDRSAAYALPRIIVRRSGDRTNLRGK
jgi:hypothetical protein